MKYIISIVLALTVLSAIPFIFGKKAPNVTTQDVFNNLKVEESDDQDTNSGENMFGQNSNNTNSNTQNSAQNSQTTQSPTPTPAATTPSPAITTPAPAPVVTTPTPVPTPPSPVNISIAGFAFSPSAVTVKRGTTVTWTNDDNVPHTSVTSQSGGFDSGMLSKGGKFSFTFQTTGTYDYVCGFHPSMRGSVIVTN